MKELRYQSMMSLSFGLFAIVAIIVLGVVLDRANHDYDRLKERVDLTCRREMYDLEALYVRSYEPASEFRATARTLALQNGIHQLCIGLELPVDVGTADACWIRTGKDDCYRDLAHQLAEIYVRKFPTRP